MATVDEAGIPRLQSWEVQSNDDGLYVIADAVAVDHVYLITLGHGEHGQHEGAGRQYRAIWAAGGRRAEVVRLDAESLVQGFRLQL